MYFDVSSVEGETQLQVYIQVQQVSNDTDPLMWWNQTDLCGRLLDTTMIVLMWSKQAP
jgi:hypothetical protein